MNMKRKVGWMGFCALALALGLALPATHFSAAVQAQESNGGKKLWAKSFLNQKAPELVTEKWLGAMPATKGKWKLIDFWATWCPPCRKTIPELNALQKQFAANLVVIGISDESAEKVRALKDPLIEYSSAIDTQARTKNQYEVAGIPHAVLIDPQGIVRWEGFPLQDGHELTPDAVKNLLAKYPKK